MFVTFIVFPGVTNSKSVNLTFIQNRAWFDLFMVFLFNFFDTIGRYTGGAFMIKSDSIWINVIGFGRLVLVVTSLLIMIGIAQNDYTAIANMTLLAFTNGYM